MPNTSGKNSSDLLPPQKLPENASLENLRKQAKSFLKTLQATFPHAKLSEAQLAVARSYGYASWPRLKQHVTSLNSYTSLPPHFGAADELPNPVDRFISFACLNYYSDHPQRRDHARELLAQDPQLATANIFAAATAGNLNTVREQLARDTSLTKQRGGPHNWEPILYVAYSRLNLPGNATLEVARELLKHGADPNAGFLWDRLYLFTALTGAFGEGELGPMRQPQHQYCYELARLLLEAGADPNDGQSLYNRMFTGGSRHLELLFEFGLGQEIKRVWNNRLGGTQEAAAEMIQQQVAWAAKYNQIDRMRCLIQNGADLNAIDTRLKRPPYELALRNGNLAMAEFLREHGAGKIELSDVDAFSVACINADEETARALLAKDPTLVQQLGQERVELLNRAAESNKLDAVRLMAQLGFDLNELKRTAPLHLAAANGHMEMIKLLVSFGANPLLADEEFGGDAAGWANYNGRHEVVEYLASLKPR